MRELTTYEKKSSKALIQKKGGVDLTSNQRRAFSVLSNEYQKLSPIVRAYNEKRDQRGWQTSGLSSCQCALNGLLKKGLVEYKYKGQWRLKKK